MRVLALLLLLGRLSCVWSHVLPRIAIIGGGIGGTSCAHFLRSLFGDNVVLDLYEAEEVGGRLALIDFGGHQYEIGGSIIHSRNKYMLDFLQLFQLRKREQNSDSCFGICNDKEFVFEESKWQILTLFKLIYRYQFGFMKLRNHINNMLDHFERIYKCQEDGMTFENVTSLLSAMDPIFSDYLHITARKGFHDEGLSEHVINELVLATLKTNYGQNLNVHKFVGSVSVAGAAGGLWAFHGGNSEVPKKLLQSSKARLIQSPVTKVRKLPTDEMEVITVKQPNDVVETDRIYDIVIVAAPQTSDMKNKIGFENFRNQIEFSGMYHRTVCTLIRGTLRREHFRKQSRCLGAILSISDNLIFNSIGRIFPVDYEDKMENLTDVWKIFSQRPLSESELSDLFSDISEKFVKVWLAYPEYDTALRNDTFVLDENLYHVNAIDWAASSMEMSVIGAKNVALLAFKNWKAKSLPKDEEGLDEPTFFTSEAAAKTEL